ncbi:hypothetical protein BEL04_18155 [Mucilaginibacter sp. PPCGB 2223]|nr:hypothetical protein BEL04_18155 [Mucilaginibacter sp. PPCGB 2223]
MPPEYECLNAPLARAQEHVFLINAEIEKIEGNPLSEAKIVKLQDEKQAVIGGIKQDFEMQTWEEGPFKFQEIEKVIDQKFSDETYNKVKATLLESGKQYDTSKFWSDRLERNLEHYKNHEAELRNTVAYDDRDIDLERD